MHVHVYMYVHHKVNNFLHWDGINSLLVHVYMMKKAWEYFRETEKTGSHMGLNRGLLMLSVLYYLRYGHQVTASLHNSHCHSICVRIIRKWLLAKCLGILALVTKIWKGTNILLLYKGPSIHTNEGCLYKNQCYSFSQF